MIVLIGFMGAGKSTVGARLAARLDLDFVDSDIVLARRLGCTIAEYFAAQGEAAFRAVEQETITGLLRGPDVVLALGGGALGSAAVRAGIAGHDVVYLDASLPQILARVGADPARPLLATGDVGELYAGRLPTYAQAATVRVDADGDLDAVTQAILDALTVRGATSRAAQDTAAATAPPAPDTPDQEAASPEPERAPDTSPRAVFVGPPGAGTSTVGRLVAQRLGLPWCDVDDLLAAQAGKSPGEVLVDDGEQEYRRAERAAARRALVRPGIVVLGGGAVMNDEIAQALGDLAVVFLDVTIAHAAPRVGFDGNPGLVVLHPRRVWTMQMARRRPRYLQVATWTVDTGGRDADDVATHVAQLLQAGRA